MTDRYERIRAALAMGPTPGPWKWWEYEDLGYCCVNPRDGGPLIAKCDVRDPFDPEQRANAALIAACDPDTISALLAEMDALAAALEEVLVDAARYRLLRKGAVEDVAVVRGLGAMDYGMSAVVYTYSEEIDGDDLDTAIDQARGKGVADA